MKGDFWSISLTYSQTSCYSFWFLNNNFWNLVSYKNLISNEMYYQLQFKIHLPCRHPASLMRKSNLDSCKRLNNSWYSFKTDLTWTRKAKETLNSLYDYNFVFLYHKLVFVHVWIEIQKETLVSLKGESIITSIFFSQQTVLSLLFV